jgi:ABC-type phosphate transport system substrate-binding protein
MTGDTAAGQSGAYTYNTVVNDPEEFAIGQDSIAIIVPSTNTWLSQASASKIADLFRTTGNGNNVPLYATWGDWAAAQSPPVTLPSGVGTQAIVHIGREFSSGTFDGFNTFFLKPFGYDMTYSASSGTTAGAWTTSDYQPKTANQDVLTAMTQSTNQYAIGFIGLGFVQNDLGTSHPDGIIPLKLLNPTTSTYIVPSIANVKNGSYVNNAATPTVIVRWLWYFMDGVPASTSASAVKSLWISYVKAHPTFLSDNGYILMNNDDMAGASARNPNTSVGSQHAPDGKVDFNDLVDFASYWIAYYGSSHQLNPYDDMNADGKIDFNDLVAFANNWIVYYQTQ